MKKFFISLGGSILTTAIYFALVAQGIHEGEGLVSDIADSFTAIIMTPAVFVVSLIVITILQKDRTR